MPSYSKEQNGEPEASTIQSCDLCGARDFRPVLSKPSSHGEIFGVKKCKKCGLVQVHPRPPEGELAKYYESSYFKMRTDRGYDDYYSERIRNQIIRVIELNLVDLGFYEWEKSLFPGEARAPRALDVGCAAGYFVDYLRSRGWESAGIEISEEAARFGKERLGIEIFIEDFRNFSPDQSFDLISLWASLEHMPSPSDVLKQASVLLKPGGRMILSTCRYGVVAALMGKEWRFMNVPEHLFFFSLKLIKRAAKEAGFETGNIITYGSGFTTKKDASFWYRLAKRFADPLVKWTGQGDMMAIELIKTDRPNQ